MKKLALRLMLIATLALIVSAPCSGQTVSRSTAAASIGSAVQDDEVLKATEIALIRLRAAEEKVKLLEDRLAAKDEIIRAKDGTISVREEQLKLALAANADRREAGNIDSLRLSDCQLQLTRADAEIHRLRYPGLFRSLFDPKVITSSVIGFGLGRLTK